MTPEELDGRFQQITLAATFMYLVLAVVVQFELRRWRRRLEQDTQLEPSEAVDFDTAVPDVIPDDILGERTSEATAAAAAPAANPS